MQMTFSVQCTLWLNSLPRQVPIGICSNRHLHSAGSTPAHVNTSVFVLSQCKRQRSLTSRPKASTAPNIARGTTDPEYWVHNLSKSFNKNSLKLISVELPYLVANLATRWRHLHWLLWPPGGGTWISYKLGHQGVPLASIRSPSNTTRICLKFSHLLRSL